MATVKMSISNVKSLFYPPCEVKCGLQNGVSTHNCTKAINKPSSTKRKVHKFKHTELLSDSLRY